MKFKPILGLLAAFILAFSFAFLIESPSASAVAVKTTVAIVTDSPAAAPVFAEFVAVPPQTVTATTERIIAGRDKAIKPAFRPETDYYFAFRPPNMCQRQWEKNKLEFRSSPLIVRRRPEIAPKV